MSLATSITGGGTGGAISASGGVSAVLASFLAANVTNDTAVMAATGLTIPVIAGKKYLISARIRGSNSTVADGIALDFDTSAAATFFWAICVVWDTGAPSTSNGVSTLAGNLANTSFDGSAVDGMVVIDGYYEPSASGNFLMRFAMVADTGGTLTLYKGSSLTLTEVA